MEASVIAAGSRGQKIFERICIVGWFCHPQRNAICGAARAQSLMWHIPIEHSTHMLVESWQNENSK